LVPDHPSLVEENEHKPRQHENWCVPSRGAEFVAAMEDVEYRFEEEYYPCYPAVCLDENPLVLHEQLLVNHQTGLELALSYTWGSTWTLFPNAPPSVNSRRL
jgi:hypothetical protein